MVALISIFTLVMSLLSDGIHSAPSYDYHFCGNVTFTPNGTYQANLNKLLTTLSSNATSNNNGFFNFSVTADSSNTVVYGMYLCRGDVTVATCAECVSDGVKNVVKMCPRSKYVVIWYDECSLRYSEVNIFGWAQEHPRVTLWTTRYSSNPNQLTKFISTTIAGEMASQAANETSGKKFMMKQVNLSSVDTLYSLVQCTPDLPAADCFRCINTAASRVNVAAGSLDVGVLFPSCSIRYSWYHFYNFPAAPSPLQAVTPPSTVPSDTTAAETNGKKSSSAKATDDIVVPVTISVPLLAAALCFLITYKRRAGTKPDDVTDFEICTAGFTTPESLQYDFNILQAATNNFSNANKLGEGGFGAVYQGKLANGQEIAVKRLSQASSQGAKEFKNEVVLVANLQHRNLVRLVGFCLAKKEKLLVYEFVPNRSLDYFLSNPEKQTQLDWTMRYKIIRGVARGILYLHEDSALRIIHRDIKASNILLDADMTPKVSDFGLAKNIGIQESRANTKRVAGTYGYMAPEYVLKGEFSERSDVYSFGVLVLEIISGQKVNKFLQSKYPEHLMSYAWKKWNDNEALEIMEPSLREGTYSKGEVIRCIHLALLCVQEDVNARPSMSRVNLMLSRRFATLPQPRNPGFYSGTKSGMYMSSSSVNSVPTTEVGPR